MAVVAAGAGGQIAYASLVVVVAKAPESPTTLYGHSEVPPAIISAHLYREEEHLSQYGFGPVTAPLSKRRGDVPVGMIVIGIFLAALGAAFNLLLSFGMVFATDSCGTSAGTGSVLCHSSIWTLLVALPWVGLAGGVLTTVLVALVVRRRGRSAWLGLAAGFGLYALMCLITLVAIFA